jgi:hypothetical protein
MHYVANQLVEADGADRARCESYGMAVHRTDGGDARGNLTTGFRFVDDFERRGGEWRIVRRVATTEWVRVEHEADRWPIPVGMLTGRRDRSDAVYAPWPAAPALARHVGSSYGENNALSGADVGTTTVVSCYFMLGAGGGYAVRRRRRPSRRVEASGAGRRRPFRATAFG